MMGGNTLRSLDIYLYQFHTKSSQTEPVLHPARTRNGRFVSTMSHIGLSLLCVMQFHVKLKWDPTAPPSSSVSATCGNVTAKLHCWAKLDLALLMHVDSTFPYVRSLSLPSLCSTSMSTEADKPRLQHPHYCVMCLYMLFTIIVY